MSECLTRQLSGGVVAEWWRARLQPPARGVRFLGLAAQHGGLLGLHSLQPMHLANGARFSSNTQWTIPPNL